MKTSKEKTKEQIIKACCSGKITAADAAGRLKLSVRQVENLKKKYREGISFLHGNCGRVSSKALAPEIVQKVLEEYRNLLDLHPNFTHFHEIIKEKGVKISYTAMRKILVENGIQSPKTRRVKTKTHKTRERRAKFGELLQTDATPFEWFGGDKKYALHALIDDATGQITGLHMSENECMDGYLEVLRQTLENHGTPEALYADGLSIFFSKKKTEDLTLEEELSGIRFRKTQFGSICDELAISLIQARSSQAKGRVERLWETLQSRLPVEFALNGINNVEHANAFLRDVYMQKFNERFGVNKDAVSSFVPLPRYVNLDRLLAYKLTRKVDNGACFQIKNIRFSISDKLIGKTIDIHISKRRGIVAYYNNNCYPVIPLPTQKKSTTSSDSVDMILSRFVFFFCLKNEHVA